MLVTIFTGAAFKYVNAIITAVMLMLTGGTVAGAALALLMVVMRGLLQKALTLEPDLAEVV